nr:GntR family transcriptional regulator [Brevibacterium daeguense]
MAKQRIESAILAGDFFPGQRLIEDRLCEELGVSRPPIREALKELELAGLVRHIPRRGSIVAPMTQHDVYEIVTLRHELEQMALRLALPSPDPERLARCEAALGVMEGIASTGDEAGMARAGFEFHIAIAGLAGHQRLENTYRAMAMQLQLCMAMNNKARRELEDLHGNLARHQELFDVVSRGDYEEAMAAVEGHGHYTFLVAAVDQLDGASPESRQWLEHIRNKAADPTD